MPQSIGNRRSSALSTQSPGSSAAAAPLATGTPAQSTAQDVSSSDSQSGSSEVTPASSVRAAVASSDSMRAMVTVSTASVADSVAAAGGGHGERIDYVVQSGDTMNAIAAKFDLTPSELARFNRISTGSMLFPGRKLAIPVHNKSCYLSSGGKPVTSLAAAATSPASAAIAQTRVSEVTMDELDGASVSTTAPPHTSPHHPHHITRHERSSGGDRAASIVEGALAGLQTIGTKVALEATTGTSATTAHSSGTARLPARGLTRHGGFAQAGDGGSAVSGDGTRDRGRVPPPHVLKIAGARHITDGQGVVTGTLLITPNNIMFSPNVSDLIVIEHGTDQYEVTAPVDMVAGAALYTDIATMRTKHAHRPQHGGSAHFNGSPRDDAFVDRQAPVCNIPVQVYYAEAASSMSLSAADGQQRHPASNTNESFVEAVTERASGKSAAGGVASQDNRYDGASSEGDSNRFSSSSGNNSGSAFSSEPTAAANSGSSGCWLAPAGVASGVDEASCGGSESGSEPVSPKPTRTPPSSPVVGGHADRKRLGAANEARCQPEHEEAARSAVNDQPDVFAALERLLPRPAQSQQDSAAMLYLCLRMGRPVNKVVRMSAVAVGRRRFRSEYWFGIPRSRVDEVYKFFQRNYPEKYGDVIGLDLKERGFEEIDSDEDDGDDDESDNREAGFADRLPAARLSEGSRSAGSQRRQRTVARRGGDRECSGGSSSSEDLGSLVGGRVPPETPREKNAFSDGSSGGGTLTGVLNRVGSFKNPFKLPRFFEGPNTPHPSFSSCEWESGTPKEDTVPSCASQARSTNESFHAGVLNPALTPDEILLPDMVDDSEILSEQHRFALYRAIPARAEGYAWRLVYSTTRHGFSLKTFYREMSRHDGPVLLAISDTNGDVFGAFVSQSIHPSDHFYGTGEMFLWSFRGLASSSDSSILAASSSVENQTSRDQLEMAEAQQASGNSGKRPTDLVAAGCFSKYSWTGDNQYFVKGNADSLVFGSGEGTFGLYIDGDLFHGRSAPCKTYNNDVLSKESDFVIQSLEAWGFF